MGHTLKSATNRHDSTMCRFLRGFGNIHGKLHGLPKKVLKFSVFLAYCQIFGIVRKFWHLGFQVAPGSPVGSLEKSRENMRLRKGDVVHVTCKVSVRGDSISPALLCFFARSFQSYEREIGMRITWRTPSC